MVEMKQNKLDVLAGLKTVEAIADIYKVQLISYLKATRLSLGLLINFNVPILKNRIQRVLYAANPAAMTPSKLNQEEAWCSLRLGG
jgi:hypothetical protein